MSGERADSHRFNRACQPELMVRKSVEQKHVTPFQNTCIAYKIKRAQMLGHFGAASDLSLEQLYDSSGVRRSEQRSELLQLTDPVLMLL